MNRHSSTLRLGTVGILSTLALALVGCFSWSRGLQARYTDPAEPVFDVNRYLEESAAATHAGILKNGKPFRIVCSPGLRVDQDAIKRRYETIIEFIEQLSGERFPRGVELVVVPLAKTPANFRFSYSPSDTYRDLIFMEDSRPEATADLLCRIEPTAPHEMWHVVGHVMLDQAGSTGAGWFEEGLAEYVHWRLSSAGCDAGPRREVALEALMDSERRAGLWRFSPFLASAELRKPVTTSEDQGAVQKGWKDVDAGYAASLGVFLVMESRVGRSRLEAIAQRLNRDFRAQTDEFYAALELELGFDVRRIDAAMIEQAGVGIPKTLDRPFVSPLSSVNRE